MIFSILFVTTCTWGTQTAIWWRLGPQEAFGLLLFAACLNCTLSLASKRNLVLRGIYIILLILLSLQKESFLVCIPAFQLLLLAFDERKLGEKIKSYAVEEIFIIVLFATEIYLIICYVGTNQIGYAGFAETDTLGYYIEGVKNNLLGQGKYAIWLMILAVVAVAVSAEKIQFNRNMLFEASFVLYIFCAQQILYAKSGMVERYLIPWIICVSYFVFLMAPRLMKDNKYAVHGIQFCGLVLFVINSRQVITNANYFAQQGQDLKVCIEALTESVDTADMIYGISNSEEPDWSLGIFLKHKFGYENYKAYSQIEEGKENLADAYFGTPQAVLNYIDTYRLNPGEYRFVNTDTYTIMFRRD